MKPSNTNLTKAKNDKNSEFYTQLSSIVNEVKHYKNHFVDKIVYCPCDKVFNQGINNFYDYFCCMYDSLGLKGVIYTQYNPKGNGFCKYYNKQSGNKEYKLVGNGSFDSDECKIIMANSDIVVTNPPFSIFSEFVNQIMGFNKQFLIIGPENAITYKDIFPNIMHNKIWLGYTSVTTFEVPFNGVLNKHQEYDDDTNKVYQKFGNVCWYTNLVHNRRTEKIPMIKKYTNELYQKYDNYDAIEVGGVRNIPSGYNGIMGVPINFLTNYCPDQFEIVGTIGAGGDFNVGKAIINGVEKYKRILVKAKQEM